MIVLGALAAVALLMAQQDSSNLQVDPASAAAKPVRQGKVIVRRQLNVGGRFEGCEVASASNPALDAAALKPVALMRMKPFFRDGHLVEGAVTIPIVFQTTDDGRSATPALTPPLNP